MTDLPSVPSTLPLALRAAPAPEGLELRAGLRPEQVLDRVEHRPRVRLDRHPVLRPQRAEVEPAEQVDHRGAARLVAANLQPVRVVAQVVGAVALARAVGKGAQSDAILRDTLASLTKRLGI